MFFFECWQKKFYFFLCISYILCIFVENYKHNKMATKKTKKEVRKEQAIKANELLKTCPKEQAKLKKQLLKLGLL